MHPEFPIESWFWDLLAEHKPKLEHLESSLNELDRTSLEKFIVFYHIASEASREPWDGPYINESIGHLSEDSTEDLTDWIVAQGFDAWNYSRTDQANWTQLLNIANDYDDEYDENIAEWFEPHPNNTESDWGAAKSAAVNIFYERFNESFYDVQEQLHDKYDPPGGT